MATKYVRTVGGNSNAAATYSLSSGGPANTTVPVAGDEVILDGNSGNFTINAAMVCRSLDCNGYTGVLTHAAGITLTIGDATAPTGGRALRFSAGMTYTLGNAATSAIALSTLNASNHTVTTNGKTVGNITFGVSGSTGTQYTLTDALNSSGTVTHGRCQFTTGNFAINAVSLSVTSTQVRVLDLGSSVITLSGTNGTVFNGATTSGLTVSSNTATVIFTGVMGSGTFASLSNINWNGLSLTHNGGGAPGVITTSGATIKDLTFNGTVSQVDAIAFTGDLTITGTITLAGNSDANRVILQSSVLGTPRTITAAVVSIVNADFMDIIGAGAGTWAGTLVGDRQGNSGITFTTPITNTFTTAGNDSAGARWSAGRVPLPQDNVVYTGSVAVTKGLFCWGKNIDFTGYTGVLTRTSSNTPNTVFGNMILQAGMNMGTAPNTMYVEYRGRGSHTITSNGVIHFEATSNQRLDVYAPGGTYTLADAIQVRTNSDSFAAILNVIAGTLDYGTGLTHIVGQVGSATPTYARTLNLHNSTIQLYSTGLATMVNIVTTNLTLDAADAIFEVLGVTRNIRTLALGGATIGHVKSEVANSLGQINVTGSGSTIKKITSKGGRSWMFPAGQTVNVEDMNDFRGEAFGYQYIQGNNASEGVQTPHNAALNLSGDAVIKYKFELPSYTTLAQMALGGKINTALTAGWVVRWNSAGTPTLFGGGTQAAASGSGSTLAAVGIGGQPLWLKVDYRSSDGRTRFFASLDDITYTQLGTDRTLPTGGLLTNTDPLYIGQRQVANDNFTGKMYQHKIYSDLAETTLIYHANFETKPLGVNSFNESSSNALAVNITGYNTLGDGRAELIGSSASGATLNKVGAPVNGMNRVFARDIFGTPNTNTWYVGANSYDGGNNTGLIFSNAPGGGGNMLMVM